jgi:L-fuconolactonase
VRVVDAQVHCNMLGTPEQTIAAMDAVGVDLVVVDEYLSPNPDGLPQAGEFFSDTGFRYATPWSEAAIAAHPDRFVSLARCQPDDPQLDTLLEAVRTTPGRVALRLIPHRPLRPGATPPAAWAASTAVEDMHRGLVDGAYDRYLSTAERLDVPVFVQVSGYGLPGNIDALVRIASTFPQLRLVVDHMGVQLPERPDEHVPLTQLDRLTPLLPFENVALKWCHMTRLATTPFPYPDVQQALAATVARFGAHRVMWASDCTIDRAWNSWAEALCTVTAAPGLSDAERSLVLGGTATDLLGLPG